MISCFARIYNVCLILVLVLHYDKNKHEYYASFICYSALPDIHFLFFRQYNDKRVHSLILIGPYQLWVWDRSALHEPFTRYVKFRGAHALGMPGTFSPLPQVRDADMHHSTCVTHVAGCIPGSQTSDFHWNRWWGKPSRHSRCMHNAQFYVSGKRPMAKVKCRSVAQFLQCFFIVPFQVALKKYGKSFCT